MMHSAGTDAWGFHKQLAAAQEETDKPAIIELSRRIVEADPQDSTTWETLARTQFEVAEYDRCTATLNAWENAVKPHPAVINDLRGDVAEARKDHKAAEQYWRSYFVARPDAVDGLEKLADLYASEKRRRNAVEFRTRALALNETADGCIRRANLYMELHDWDKALDDSDKANALDPSDAAVKEWLPKFELLRKFVRRIKLLDAQIGKSQGAAVLWLDRARLLTLANRSDLALTDCRQAMKLGPGIRPVPILRRHTPWTLWVARRK